MWVRQKNDGPIAHVVGPNPPILLGVAFYLLLMTALLYAWQVGRDVGAISSLFASPSEMYGDFVRLLERGQLPEHLFASFKRVGVGLVFGTLIGFPMGILIALFPYARFCAIVVIPFLLTFSKISVLYLMIIWLGIDEGPKYGISIWATFLYQLLLSFQGSYKLFYGKDRHTRELMADIAIMGPSRWQLYWHIMPALLPRMFLGLLLASPVCWLMLVLSEGVNRQYGVGSLIHAANQIPIVSMIISGTVLLALCGITTWILIWVLEKKVIPWNR